MKVRIRYDNSFQTVEVTEAECESMIRADYEERLAAADDPSTVQPRSMQEIFDEQFNKPEYNSYHAYYRRTSGLEACDFEGETFADETDAPDRILESKEFMEAVLSIVQELKPERQELVQRVLIDGQSMADVAREFGVDRSNISHRIDRITKLLKKNLKNL